jgi:hypothetical protein
MTCLLVVEHDTLVLNKSALRSASTHDLTPKAIRIFVYFLNQRMMMQIIGHLQTRENSTGLWRKLNPTELAVDLFRFGSVSVLIQLEDLKGYGFITTCRLSRV